MLNFDNIKIISNSNNNIIINKLDVGSIIQVSNDIKNMYNIKNDICFCKINFHKLSQVLSNENKFQKNSNFPSIIRDISILINKKYSYSDITDSILQNGGKHLTNVNLFDVYVDNKTSDKEHSLSYSLKFSSKERTLKDKEIDVVINKIINLLKKKYHVLQR